METYYEWVCEQTDEYGDIIDPMFDDTYTKVKQYIEDDEYIYNIALVRNTGCEEDGVVDRGYAYIKDGKLEPQFDNGYNVPKRFINKVYK